MLLSQRVLPGKIVLPTIYVGGERHLYIQFEGRSSIPLDLAFYIECYFYDTESEDGFEGVVLYDFNVFLFFSD